MAKRGIHRRRQSSAVQRVWNFVAFPPKLSFRVPKANSHKSGWFYDGAAPFWGVEKQIRAGATRQSREIASTAQPGMQSNAEKFSSLRKFISKEIKIISVPKLGRFR